MRFQRLNPGRHYARQAPCSLYCLSRPWCFIGTETQLCIFCIVQSHSYAQTQTVVVDEEGNNIGKILEPLLWTKEESRQVNIYYRLIFRVSGGLLPLKLLL